jgi:ketosteroid isomerase-like protein
MSAEQDVQIAIEERLAALKAGDAGKLEDLLADEVCSINPSGFVQGKQEMLDDLSSRDLKVDLADAKDIKVTVHKDTAIALYRVKMNASYKGQLRGGHSRVLAVYVKSDSWKLLAQQVTAVREMS